MTTKIQFDSRYQEIVTPTEPLTTQAQADLAARELCNEDNLGGVYSDWGEVMAAVQEARESGSGGVELTFAPGTSEIPAGVHDMAGVTLCGSNTKGDNTEISFADGALVDNLSSIKDVKLVALGAPPLRYDNSFQGPKPKKSKRGPVDGKKRGKRRRDFGAAGKGFNAKGNR